MSRLGWHKMFVVVAYDIIDDNNRHQIAELLKDYGVRVQYSVFECLINKGLLNKMKQELLQKIDLNEDSINIYYCCDSCAGKRRSFGIKKHVIVDDGPIII